VLRAIGGEPNHFAAATVFCIIAVFCLLMGLKSWSYLRTQPVPSRVHVAVGAGLTCLVGGIGGAWLVIALSIPYLMLLWAIGVLWKA
jgi:hypothetical protein